MDRRQFDREPTNLELYAQIGEQERRRLRARDISSDGVFVQGWETPPAPGARVNLTFLIGAGPVVKLLRRVAMVARVTSDGVGLVHGTRALLAGICAGARPSPWSSLQWPEVD